MKTTFDLPEPLLRRAKAAAAQQGRPLRDLVAEAIEGKLASDEATARAAGEPGNAWKAFTARLQKLPDGSYFNPDGIEAPGFFEALEGLRAPNQAWLPRDPFAPPAPAARLSPSPAGKRKSA